jgi:MinD-like ATPase involved in chromosome partitioning or flagellar assembly
MSKKILCATARTDVNRAVSKFDGYEVIGEIDRKEEVVASCFDLRPDILLLTEFLGGRDPLPEVIISLTQKVPGVRVVLLTGSINNAKEDRRSFFEAMVYAGVYDIVHENNITPERIKSALDNPKSKGDVSYLMRKKRIGSKNEGGFEFDDDVAVTEEKDYYDNLFAISSIKPGTGKSFVSTNVAVMIAEQGIRNEEGKRPKVALIEADLQNLSLGTLLQIEDGKYNLKTTMNKIRSIFTKDGTISGDMVKRAEVDEHIRASFKPYKYSKNLYALVGSQVTIQDLEDVTAYHYMYLINAIVNDYDVLIIDTNSALTHITTFPLLCMSKFCYYILNLDFNNVRNNCRYRGFLETLGILDKVRYLLNEDITEDMDNPVTGIGLEPLIYDSNMVEKEFQLEAKIPMLPKAIFLNHIYEGKPVVLDTHSYTAKARYEIAKVADQIWPIEDFDKIKKEAEKLDKSRKGIFGKR